MVKPKPDWTPFERSFIPELDAAEKVRRIADIVARFPSISEAEASKTLDDVRNDIVVLNSRYQVNMRLMRGEAPFGDILHLSIKRLDKERVGVERYRDFQRIKTELVGPEYEAVEIYPAYGDEIDTANQYHLWVFRAGYKLPFGWHGNRAVDGTSPLGGKQTPL